MALPLCAPMLWDADPRGLWRGCRPPLPPDPPRGLTRCLCLQR